jgi:hypothetical protein
MWLHAFRDTLTMDAGRRCPARRRVEWLIVEVTKLSFLQNQPIGAAEQHD